LSDTPEHHAPEETVAAPGAATRPLTLSALEAAIRAAWGRDTSDDPDEWTPDWSARGQCGVTSLVVRDLLGGEILIAPVIGSAQEGEHHAWNRLPSGLELDLTAEQFLAGETLGPAVAREPYGHERAAVLAARVRERLAAS
jgi:hypothetical protein